jgi:MGT family glycosyltransferase
MTLWDGGGNAPPQLAIAGRVVARGHAVHVLADPTLAGAAEAAGCSFSSWQRASEQAERYISNDRENDWENEEPLDVFRRLRDELMSGPASAFADDTAAVIERVRPDALVTDSQLFGSIMAAEQAGIPVAALVPNLWAPPTPGTGDPGLLRLITRVVNGGTADLNAARAARGMPPVAAFYDQLFGVNRILMLTSETLDHASPFVPDNVRYVGPVLDDPVWTEPWSSPWPESNTDPLVLVGFTSIYQNQSAVLQRVIDALAPMKVRAVVALGRLLQPSALTATENVVVVRSVPHSLLLKEASLVISHCGHGTTVKALAAGVPMLCLPMGRDQDPLAERVASLGAGVRLSPGATTAELGQGIRAILENDDYRANAARLASTFATEHQPIDVVLQLEDAVGSPASQ